MSGRSLCGAIVLCVLTTASGEAQTAAREAARPDIAGMVGWQNVNKSELGSYNDWYNRAVHGAVTFGWHWSPHLKTELEASASTREEFYASTETVINGIRTYVTSEYEFQTRRLTLSQQYQFGENAWFHPHLAAGVDFNWETQDRFDRDVHLYDPVTRQNSIVGRAVRHPERTELHVRPLAAAGFKAYMTPRSFVRSDLRVVAGRRIEDVIVRFGFGVDF
jgi:hypothetical protein